MNETKAIETLITENRILKDRIAQLENPWTKISDGLPENSGLYLCEYSNLRYGLTHYTAGRFGLKNAIKWCHIPGEDYE